MGNPSSAQPDTQPDTQRSSRARNDSTQEVSPDRAQPHKQTATSESRAASTTTSAHTQSASSADAPEQVDAEMERLRHELANTPAEVVVSNHAYGLFELAAVYLSEKPPKLPQAQLAIDALGGLVAGVKGRLGDSEKTIDDALAQIRLAYLQISKSQPANDGT